MKAVLVSLAFLSLGTAFAGPAFAFDRSDYAYDIRDRGGWDGDGYGRNRDDWRRERWEERGDLLSERQVARQLRRQGFVRIDDIELRRDRYIVRAVRPNGALIRLSVDAYDGEVVARERIGWVTDDRGPPRRGDRPTATGIEFDLGGGTLGIYSR